MPSMAALAGYTHQVFVNNNWEHLLASTPLRSCAAAAVAIPARLGCPSTIKHVFLIVRENRTYDQDLGDISQGNGDAAYAQFGATITPNGHKLANTYGLFDNFYDEGTLSADGHNWLMQADANDYIEKEFGAFYRSYPAQGGDALAYQRDGFLWNAAQAAGQTVKSYGEYNNFLTQPTGATWSQYYQDSQIMEGKASRPAAGTDLGDQDLRRHPLAERHRRPRLPGLRPEHPGPVPDGHLAAVVPAAAEDQPGAQPQPDLDA